ncbi:hypothetical protein BVRB_4g088450 [Beta vulgaris subsp. vulgaris]|nr:hypothetical protein BVRB_4g088450 [Beta vulgaris subsp. vulgaris]
MENRYWGAYVSEELQEEDVWAVKEETATGFKVGELNDSPRASRRSISRRLPSASRMIPGAQKHQHNDNSNESKVVQSSAPVNIPDWSKIYGKSPIEKNNGSCDNYYVVCDGAGSDENNEDYEDDDDDDDDGRLPPHTWLAKKLARSQISSFSVCEGVGRTLKGRDLSRVRNAVLSKTGFL